MHKRTPPTRKRAPCICKEPDNKNWKCIGKECNNKKIPSIINKIPIETTNFRIWKLDLDRKF